MKLGLSEVQKGMPENLVEDEPAPVHTQLLCRLCYLFCHFCDLCQTKIVTILILFAFRVLLDQLPPAGKFISITVHDLPKPFTWRACEEITHIYCLWCVSGTRTNQSGSHDGGNAVADVFSILTRVLWCKTLIFY